MSFLSREGYRVMEAANGHEAIERIKHEKPALILLDIEMPHMGGLTVLKRLRDANDHTPVLIASSRSHVDDRVESLTLGADDYLTKPFDFGELLARIQAILRRHSASAPSALRLQFGDVEVVLSDRLAYRQGQTIRLSRTEWSILDVLAQSAGKPVSREKLFDVVWGYTYLPASRTLDTHVWRLRKKIGDTGTEPRWIKNVSGIGYQLECSGDKAHSGA